jgi:disulfide oxidoreductase YuzD
LKGKTERDKNKNTRKQEKLFRKIKSVNHKIPLRKHDDEMINNNNSKTKTTTKEKKTLCGSRWQAMCLCF